MIRANTYNTFFKNIYLYSIFSLVNEWAESSDGEDAYVESTKKNMM